MNNILDERVTKVIAELRAIQAELSPASSPPNAGLATPKLSPELVHQLKSVVDHLRLLLWAYADSLGGSEARELQAFLQKARLERTTEMLQALRDEIARSGMPPAPEARLFIGEVQAMAQLVAIGRRS